MNPANIARATLVAALLMLGAGPLHRFGVIGWQVSLGLFVGAALLAGIGACWCLYQLLRRRGGTITVIAAAAGFAAVAVPVAVVVNAGDKPPINDISTDTTTPPPFQAIDATLRGADASPIDYNPAFAPEQARAYPEVRPLDLPLEPGKAFDVALAACDPGWQIILADRAAGRIEAVERSTWWGYSDDVVIRLTATPTGTRVDMRSKSRVGQSDLGANAQRIAAYLDRVAAEMRKAG
ncbi:DUF1499 domain-containing protein [Sandarakinorhabdus sp. AAP62]|uniref:DUF1499 domain-containing protein n=1 Tax=Sandarakinorhabdus sp. AAP62 TaxID=1248916 RepID=UPI0002FC7F0A|nr:DUF1499 domain-containing protein [Sandarakinorhabdus sp. AAP62]